MKHYFALFKQTKQAVEVEFPDLPGCVTFGDDWDEAVENATDVLAAWLATAEMKFIKKPSTYKQLEGLKGTLVPIAVDASIMEQYSDLKRINVIFPAKILRAIDTYRKAKGLKRSKFLEQAAMEYLDRHALRAGH